MSHHTSQEPYIPRNPGDLITAEDWNEMQQYVRADLADNAAADAATAADLEAAIQTIDAPKFGGKTPDEWTTTLDGRYIRRDEPQAAGQYRRYFKQIDQEIVGAGVEPVVIEHQLCRYPLIELYELMPLFNAQPTLKGAPADPAEWPFVWDQTKFLIYYASNRDPVAEYLSTEAGERIYWGDPIILLMDQFDMHPAMTQKLDDVFNDLWGKMFGSQEEDDDFRSESYGHSPYVQKWIDGDKSVDDLVKGGQWDDLKMGIRPMLLSSGLAASFVLDGGGGPSQPGQTIRAYHISQNAIEIHAPRLMDLMVLLRT